MQVKCFGASLAQIVGMIRFADRTQAAFNPPQ